MKPALENSDGELRDAVARLNGAGDQHGEHEKRGGERERDRQARRTLGGVADPDDLMITAGITRLSSSLPKSRAAPPLSHPLRRNSAPTPMSDEHDGDLPYQGGMICMGDPLRSERIDGSIK